MRLSLRQPLAAVSFPMILSAVPDAADPIPDGAAVDAQHIVETLPQQTFDDMARIACSICNADMALVLQTEQSRPILRAQWGVPPARQARLLALCAAPVPEPDRVSVIATPAIAFYARVPLLSPEGHALATVAVLDDRPGDLSPDQRAGLEAMARQAASMLERRHKALQVRRLLDEREYLHARMERYQRDLERRNAELHQLARHDSLTGLWNRGALDAMVNAPDSATRLFTSYYSVAMLDIDRFKAINDKHGHAMGDEALRRVAAVISDCLRGNDVAARYGGEEFVLVMPSTHLAGARTVVERIRVAVQELDLPFPLTLSAGLAAGRPDVDASRMVFLHADQALYQAKHGGRNRVVAYEE
jgi:diguanylate cyclase (GGDEF)-like protein